MKETESLSTGTQLEVSAEYYRDAYECLVEIALSLGFTVWRTIDRSDLDEAFAVFNELCVAYLSEGKYSLAASLLDFGTSHFSPVCNEQIKKALVINRAQAYKWSGLSEKAMSILKAEDWSAADERFKLAVAVLTDDYDAAVESVKALHKLGKRDANSYREWPLFKELRKHQEFQRVFTEIYGEPLKEVKRVRREWWMEPL